MTSRRVAAAVFALALAASGSAAAHTRSMSTSSWEIEPGPTPAARVVVRVALADLQPLLIAAAGPSGSGALSPAVQAAVDADLASRFVLRAGGEACARTGPVTSLPTADPAHAARSWRVRCERAGPLEVRAEAFFDAIATHLHLARVRIGDGKPFERVVVIERRSFSVDGEEAAAAPSDGAASGAGSTVVEYVVLGVEHIVGGIDHLVFLLALLLAGRTVGQVAMIVTGFTAAHSVTLALGVLGVVQPSSAAVESLIGLSIAIVALENFMETVRRGTRHRFLAGLAACLALALAASLAGRFAVPAVTLAGVGLFTFSYAGLLERVRRPERLRWLIAFVFGLVHGFGFAGALTEAALPADRLAQALFGFNFGVELGQLAIVALVWPLLQLALRRSEPARAGLVQLGSAPVLAAGVYWFASRALA
jgi:hypothetical protein